MFAFTVLAGLVCWLFEFETPPSQCSQMWLVAAAPRSAALLGGDRVQQRGSQGIPMQVGPSFPEADEGQRRGSNRFKAPSVHDDSDDPDDCVILGEIRSSATVPPPAAASGSAAVGGAGPGLGGSGARGAAWPGAGRGGDTGRHDNWWTAAGPSGRTDVNDEGQSPLKNGPEQRVPKSPGPTLSTPGQESGPGRGATGEDESSDVEILDGPQKSKEWEAAKQTKRKHREERAPPQPGAHAEGAAGGLANGAVHEGGASAFKRGRTEVPGATPGPSSPGLRTGGDKFSFSQVVRERAAAGAKEGGSGPQGKGEGGQKRKADEEGDRRQKQQKVPPLADLRARVHGGPSAAAQAGGKGNARGPTVMTGLFSSGGAGLRPLIPKGSQAPSSANGWKKRPVGQEAGKSERGAAPAARDAAPVGPRATAKREEGEGMPASTSVSRVAEPAAPRQEDGAGGRDQEVPQSVGPAREGTENSGRNTMERTDNAVSEVAERANAEAGASVNSEDGDGRSALEKGGEHKDPHQSEAGPLDTGALEAELREGEQDGAGTPVVLREALKESEEFRSADAAEWEQRQAAIDKQVRGAQASCAG